MTNWDMESSKMPSSSFPVGHHAISFPSETPLEQTNVFFTSGYQLEIPPGLGMGVGFYFFQF